MKKNRILSILLTLVILSVGFVLPVSAATPTLTKAHYPAGVVVNDGKLYWVAPTMAGLSTTKLYKLTDGEWGTGTTVTSPATLSDANAVYKLEFVYSGYSSEYIIQKNSAANPDGDAPYGYTWGTGTPYYMSIAADDRATNNHSLYINCYAQANNGRWIEFVSNGTLIPNDLATTGKKYKLEFDYKSSTSASLWLNGEQKQLSSASSWTHNIQVIDWNDSRNSKTYELGFELAWYLNVQIDNLELYELDASGQKTGENLVPFDGTFESSDNSATNGISNVKTTPEVGSAKIEWSKGENVLATRVYNPDGNLIAELGDATSLTIDGLTMGERKAYKIASVYNGGYESAPVTVNVEPKWFDYTINKLVLNDGTSSEATTLAAGTYTAHLEITNNKSTPATAELIAAVYKDNELVKVYGSGKQTIGTEPITASVTLSEDMFETGKTTKVYLYVFDGIDTREVITGGVEY